MRKKLATPTVVPPLGLKYRRFEVEEMEPELPRADQFWRNREQRLLAEGLKASLEKCGYVVRAKALGWEPPKVKPARSPGSRRDSRS